jgi:hypothetical protein
VNYLIAPFFTDVTPLLGFALAPSIPGAGIGGAYGTPGRGIMSLGAGNGNSFGGDPCGPGKPPLGIGIVEGGHGMGRPVTGSKQPSIIFPLPVSWQGTSVLFADQPFEVQLCRQPTAETSRAVPSNRADELRNITGPRVSGVTAAVTAGLEAILTDCLA